MTEAESSRGPSRRAQRAGTPLPVELEEQARRGEWGSTSPSRLRSHCWCSRSVSSAKSSAPGAASRWSSVGETTPWRETDAPRRAREREREERKFDREHPKRARERRAWSHVFFYERGKEKEKGQKGERRTKNLFWFRGPTQLLTKRHRRAAALLASLARLHEPACASRSPRCKNGWKSFEVSKAAKK